MEAIIEKIRLLAKEGAPKDLKEQVNAFCKIYELMLSNHLLSTQAPGQVHNSELGQFHQELMSREKFHAQLKRLLERLLNVDEIDPLVVSIRQFLSLVNDERFLIPSSHTMNVEQSEELFCHYIESDSLGKYELLKSFVQTVFCTEPGFTIQEKAFLSSEDVEKEVSRLRPFGAPNVSPKPLDFIEILLPESVSRIVLHQNEPTKVQLDIELIWLTAMSKVMGTEASIERSFLSTGEESFYLELNLKINSQVFEWLYRVDDTVDESVFEDINGIAKKHFRGQFIFEDYGKSQHLSFAYLPPALAEPISQLI